MHSFPVLVLSFAVCFLSPFPDSLPQLFLRCLLPAFAFRIFRVPSASFRPLPLRFRLLSPLLLPFRSSRLCLTVASSVLPLRFRFPGFPHSFLPDFSCILSWFPYSAFCWFPFVLPCFAPAAVPQVIPFQISPPGPTPDFRFLSSASVVAPHYSASVSSFPFSSCLRLTVASSVLRVRSRFFGFPRSPRPDLSRLPSFPVPVLSFLFVSFRPSLLRSHSRSTGACLLLSLSAFPLPFRFLSSASVPVLTTQPAVLPFRSSRFHLSGVFPVRASAFASALSPFSPA